MKPEKFNPEARAGRRPIKVEPEGRRRPGERRDKVKPEKFNPEARVGR